MNGAYTKRETEKQESLRGLRPETERAKPRERKGVRKKDSGIRNGFLHGLLKDVEECYGMNTTSKHKLAGLISNANFAHVSYDFA
ncbi:hypothetical protein FRC06_002978, partial [Ceratobasidium sp. 370]